MAGDYRFYLERLNASTDRNTLLTWLEAIPVTVMATTMAEASRMVFDLSGDPGPGRRWVVKTLKIEEVSRG